MWMRAKRRSSRAARREVGDERKRAIGIDIDIDIDIDPWHAGALDLSDCLLLLPFLARGLFLFSERARPAAGWREQRRIRREKRKESEREREREKERVQELDGYLSKRTAMNLANPSLSDSPWAEVRRWPEADEMNKEKQSMYGLSLDTFRPLLSRCFRLHLRPLPRAGRPSRSRRSRPLSSTPRES